MVKFLRGVGLAWCYAIVALIVISICFTIYQRGIWNGGSQVLYWFSPFNFANYIATAIALAPGLVCLGISQKLAERRS